MKKLVYIIPVLLILLVGCGNKVEGDKELYKDVKTAYIKDIKRYDKKYSGGEEEKTGLDKNDLDDYPLAIYNVDGDYAVIYETPKKQKIYFGYKSDNQSIYLSVSEYKVIKAMETLTLVYSQNDFK